MIDLSEKSLSTWLRTCPPDVREFVSSGGALAPGGCAALAGTLGSAPEVEFPAILRGDPQGARALGRVGRVRLLARVAETGGEDAAAVIRRIVGEEVEDEGAAGSDEVGVLFLEDLREMARSVVGPRVASRVVDGPALDVSAEAAFTLESDFVFRQGGV